LHSKGKKKWVEPTSQICSLPHKKIECQEKERERQKLGGKKERKSRCGEKRGSWGQLHLLKPQKGVNGSYYATGNNEARLKGV